MRFDLVSKSRARTINTRDSSPGQNTIDLEPGRTTIWPTGNRGLAPMLSEGQNWIILFAPFFTGAAP
jgi:hypothetical protein